MAARLIFHGSRQQPAPCDLSRLLQALNAKRLWLHGVPIADLLTYCDTVARVWQSDAMRARFPYLKNISGFLSRKTLERRLAIALHGDTLTLDQFVDLGDPELLFHAQPRGLTVHWLAGNVPVLGLFSLFSALLTKNVVLAKASVHGWETLVELLDTLRSIDTEKLHGQDLAQCLAVVLVGREDQQEHEFLSRRADVRVAWGGKEAIEIVQKLPKESFCEDIVFGPKYSYALVDHAAVTGDAAATARRLAVDVAVFDQQACSSPHTVFVEGTAAEAKAFAGALADALAFVGRTMLPKGPVDPATAMEILERRAMAAIQGTVWNSPDTEWTVIFTQEPGLVDGCASRVIVVKPIDEIGKLAQFNNRQKQTLGVALASERKLALLDVLTLHGIDRAPELGSMTFYESPWDGMFVFDRFVRWVTTAKPPR